MSGHEKHVRNEMKKLARKLRAAAEEAASFEASSFEKHAQFLRDSSGLCRKGLVRLAWNSIEKKVGQRALQNLRDHPDVARFLQMARECPPEQLENLARLILQEMDGMDPHPLRPEAHEDGLAPRFGSRDLRSRSPSYVEVRIEQPVEEPEPLPAPSASRRDGTRRPRSPSRSPIRQSGVGRRPLPTPPPLPQSFNWQRPWSAIAAEMTKADGDQLWLVCPCQRWFRQPSAVKQHFSHKVDQGPHPSADRLEELQFDELWDDTWTEMCKRHKLRQAKATPLEARVESPRVRVEEKDVGPKARVSSPRTRAEKRVMSPEGEWPEGVPKPPKPDPAQKKRLVEEGWMEPVPTAVVELLSLQAFQKASKTKLATDHWYEQVGPIIDQIKKELLDGYQKQLAFTLIKFQDVSRWSLCFARLGTKMT